MQLCRQYSILVQYPVDRVDDINKLKYGDFLVADGMCVGVVAQDNPTDVSIQIQVGRKAMLDNRNYKNTDESDDVVVSESTNSSSKDEVVKKYNNLLVVFENRLSNFAYKINSGNDNKATLKATGTVLKEDIENTKGNFKNL